MRRMRLAATPKVDTERIRTLMAPWARSQRKRLIIVAVASVLGGLAEAGLLVILARSAFALAETDNEIRIQNGLVGDVRVSLGVLLLVAGGLVVFRMLLQWLGAVTGARAFASVIYET